VCCKDNNCNNNGNGNNTTITCGNGTSKEDKTVEGGFMLEEGYENLVITAQNLSSYEYSITVYVNDNYCSGIEYLAANETADMTIPFSSITNDLIIKYESLK